MPAAKKAAGACLSCSCTEEKRCRSGCKWADGAKNLCQRCADDLRALRSRDNRISCGARVRFAQNWNTYKHNLPDGLKGNETWTVELVDRCARPYAVLVHERTGVSSIGYLSDLELAP